MSLASIFGSDKPDLSKFDPDQLRVLIATGDVIPAREVNYKMVTHHDWLYPWRQTADYLRAGDLLFINLESPLIAGCPIIHGGFKFCGDARAVAGLDYARVAVANIANNHFTNFGPTAVNDTILLLAQHNIGVSGLGHWETRDDRGIKFGFVGFNGIGTHIDRAEMKREIAIVRAQADVVVAAFHWGKEYELVPMVGAGIAPDDPREIGHLAIDDGADLVIGNHPHWVQGVEIYHDKRGRPVHLLRHPTDPGRLPAGADLRLRPAVLAGRQSGRRADHPAAHGAQQPPHRRHPLTSAVYRTGDRPVLDAPLTWLASEQPTGESGQAE